MIPTGVIIILLCIIKKTKCFDMHPTSHYIDPKKKTDVRKGRAIIMRVRGADGYSTVYKQPRKKDVHGQPFTDKFSKYENVGALSKYQLARLKRFIK